MPRLSYTRLIPAISSFLGPAPTRASIAHYLTTSGLSATQRLVTQLQQQMRLAHRPPDLLTVAHTIAYHVPECPSQRAIDVQARKQGFSLTRSGTLGVTAQLRDHYPALWPTTATIHPVWSCPAPDVPLFQAFLLLTGLPPSRVVLFILRGFVMAWVAQRMTTQQAHATFIDLAPDELAAHAQVLSRFSVASVEGTAIRGAHWPARLHLTLQPVDQANLAFIDRACAITHTMHVAGPGRSSRLSALSVAVRFLLCSIGRHQMGVLPLAQEVQQSGALTLYRLMAQCPVPTDGGHTLDSCTGI